MADDNWIVDRIPIGPGLTKKHGRLDVNIADPRFTDPSLTTPPAHAYTHADGGSDEVTLAQSQITDLVTDLADKVDTGDARLSDARTPTAHHTTHEDGGSDEVTLAMSQITGLADALDEASLGGLPPYTADDAGRILGVLDDGTLAWFLPADGTIELPRFYDSIEEYDTTTTYDAEYH